MSEVAILTNDRCNFYMSNSNKSKGNTQMEEFYFNLINAIILQCFKDYKNAVRKLNRNPDNDYALYMIRDIEKFCRSSWCLFMTDIDGEWLIKQMKIFSKEVANNGRNSK